MLITGDDVTVGKFYATSIIQEFFRKCKQSRHAKIQNNLINAEQPQAPKQTNVEILQVGRIMYEQYYCSSLLETWIAWYKSSNLIRRFLQFSVRTTGTTVIT